MRLKNWQIYFVLIFIFSILFISFLGSVNLYDWDEANFAEIAREMILTDNYLQPQINYLPFYEKPPFFIWLQVVAMKIFGINEFGARFPNAILGIIVALSIYFIGKKEIGKKFGLIWVLTFMGSFLPMMYFRTGLIDPLFNYFMFLSIVCYKWATDIRLSSTFKNQKKISRSKFLILSALFLGIAVQTKGPAALIILFGTIGIWGLISKLDWKYYLDLSIWAILSILFSSFWFLYETKIHGNGYIDEFIKYQIRLFTTEDATHGGPIYYHIIVLLLGCFPASIFLLFKKEWKSSLENSFFKLLTICGLLVLILFSIVQTKIIHYSSMAYFPISFIAAWTIYYSKFRNEQWLRTILNSILYLLIFCLILLPVLGNNLSHIMPLVKDSQARAQLCAAPIWKYSECFYGVLVLMVFIILNKKINQFYVPFFVTTSFIVIIMLLFFAPKIERITQGSYIDFCKTLKGKDVYIQPLYLKSYAHLFYSDRQPFPNDTSKNFNWLYLWNVDKKAYFFSKTKDSIPFKYPRPYIRLIEQKNGFDFYYREAIKQ